MDHHKGGHRGFNRVIWTVKEYVPGGDSPYITLYYRSFDGEQGENQITNNVLTQTRRRRLARL
jgi:hypothetical protein